MGLWAKLKAEWSKARAEVAAKDAKRALRQAPISNSAADSGPVGYNVASRLTSAFEHHRDGYSTIEVYAAEVREVQSDVKEMIALTRSSRKDMDPYENEAEMEQLEADLEECRWRLKWIDDQQYKASITRDGFAERGKWARFEYVDNDGVMSNRSITMWEKRGGYIVGYDRSRKAERTFRQDRISDWKSG